MEHGRAGLGWGLPGHDTDGAGKTPTWASCGQSQRGPGSGTRSEGFPGMTLFWAVKRGLGE